MPGLDGVTVAVVLLGIGLLGLVLRRDLVPFTGTLVLDPDAPGELDQARLMDGEGMPVTAVLISPGCGASWNRRWMSISRLPIHNCLTMPCRSGCWISSAAGGWWQMVLSVKIP